MSSLTEILNSAAPEQIEKAKACKSADDVLAFAKAEGMDITAEQAKQIFAITNPQNGELPDEELDSGAGGAVQKMSSIYEVKCPNCKTVSTAKTHTPPRDTHSIRYFCRPCFKVVTTYELSFIRNEPYNPQQPPIYE